MMQAITHAVPQIWLAEILALLNCTLRARVLLMTPHLSALKLSTDLCEYKSEEYKHVKIVYERPLSTTAGFRMVALLKVIHS